MESFPGTDAGFETFLFQAQSIRTALVMPCVVSVCSPRRHVPHHERQGMSRECVCRPRSLQTSYSGEAICSPPPG